MSCCSSLPLFSRKCSIKPVTRQTKDRTHSLCCARAAIPVCIAMAAWDLSHAHEHHYEGPVYSYMHIRSKEFPWGDCALFDKECWAEARGEAKEEH